MSMPSAIRCVSLPLPSSPHCVPIRTMPGMRWSLSSSTDTSGRRGPGAPGAATRSLLGSGALRPPLDPEADPDVGVVLGDGGIGDPARCAEHDHLLDPAQRPGRLVQRLLGGMPPALG